MKVRVAESAGFCMGVRKAMDTVLEASKGNPKTYTLGPLIHNPQAIKMLESRNVFVANEIDDTLTGETVVIRAHGITQKKREQLAEIGANIVDGTCPKVLRSELIIKKYRGMEYDIVIVGDRGHAEIDALMSYTDDRGIVVENIAEAKALPRYEKVCVVAQTTFNDNEYNEISVEVKSHADGECHIANTVCRSTERRQADVRKLAEETDATVVVGGKSSANTRRLAEISRDLGQPTFLIEKPSELDLSALSQYEEIGITAGASTPNWVIKQVIDSISGYTPETKQSLYSLFMTFAYFAIEGNFVLCAGASALTFAMFAIMDLPLSPLLIMIPFFYLFPLHAINKYLEINWKQVVHPLRLKRFWTIYLAIGVGSLFVTFAIAWVTGPVTFVLVAISYLLGTLYSVPIIPEKWHTRIRSLRDIPGSKDLVIAGAWTYAVVGLPAISYGMMPGLRESIAGLFVFTLVFSRTTLLALGGIQSDRLVGHETIPVFIGRKSAIKILNTANIAIAAAIIAEVALKFAEPANLLLLAPIAYMLFCIHALRGKGRFFTLYHQMMLDADFFITALLAFLVL